MCKCYVSVAIFEISYGQLILQMCSQDIYIFAQSDPHHFFHKGISVNSVSVCLSIITYYITLRPRNIIPGCKQIFPWWRHQMETFSALLAIFAGNSPITGKFPAQRPVTRSYDILFDPHLIKRSSKESRGCWCEMPSPSLWRHCNTLSLSLCPIMYNYPT